MTNAMKRTVVKINESQLCKMISESVKKILRESEPWNEEPYSKKRTIHTPDPYGYDQGPSDLEEEFDDELYNLVESYKDSFLARGFKIEEFKSFCYEIVDKAIG